MSEHITIYVSELEPDEDAIADDELTWAASCYGVTRYGESKWDAVQALVDELAAESEG